MTVLFSKDEFIFDVWNTCRRGQPFGGYHAYHAVFHIPVTAAGLYEFPDVGGVVRRYPFELRHDFGAKFVFHFDKDFKEFEEFKDVF
jgi:hypothetical protein